MYTTIFIIAVVAIIMIINQIIKRNHLDGNEAEKKMNSFSNFGLIFLAVGITIINLSDFTDEKPVSTADVPEDKPLTLQDKYDTQAYIFEKYKEHNIKRYESYLKIKEDLDEMEKTSINDKKLHADVIKTRAKVIAELAKLKKEVETSSTAQPSTYASDADIDAQFSKWDGAHIKTEEYVKAHLKDPDSYEHVSSKYKARDGYLEVILTYRGKNSFNATTTESVKAKCDLQTGEVLSISN